MPKTIRACVEDTSKRHLLLKQFSTDSTIGAEDREECTSSYICNINKIEYGDEVEVLQYNHRRARPSVEQEDHAGQVPGEAEPRRRAQRRLSA